MNQKKKPLYIFLFIILSIWIVSLLAIYLPTTNFVIPTFPLTQNNHILTIFLVSTALSSITSFLVGLSELGKIPNVKLNH